MLVGLGFRVTGFGQTSDTRTMVVTSKDAEGVKFVITAHDKVAQAKKGFFWAVTKQVCL